MECKLTLIKFSFNVLVPFLSVTCCNKYLLLIFQVLFQMKYNLYRSCIFLQENQQPETQLQIITLLLRFNTKLCLFTNTFSNIFFCWKYSSEFQKCWWSLNVFFKESTQINRLDNSFLYSIVGVITFGLL